MSHRRSHTRKNSGKSLLAGLGLRRRGAVRGKRDTGSLLILCVTVLVIIALVGIAFLQRVRLDQAATARHERDFMDQVISGILSDITGQLKDDIFDNAKTRKELYDYPWTKHTVQHVTAYYGNDTPVLVNGEGTNTGTEWISNHVDDRWLASTAPILNTNNTFYHWLHLSNLTGIWLDLPAYGSGNANPREWAIDGLPGNIVRSDTDIRLREKMETGDTSSLSFIPAGYEQLGVDTDLDGILDARWQWAPRTVREFAGRQYVMAVRIVDLSSMINVNTATISTVDGSSVIANRARGYTPLGVDLSRLLKRVNYNGNTALINNIGMPGEWFNEFGNLLYTRSLQNDSNKLLPPGYSRPLLSAESKLLWERQASIYGNLDRNYLSDSELDLRRQGGVNDFSIESPLENDLPQLLRQAANFETSPSWGIEGTFEDVVDPNNTLSFEQQIGRWFYGDPDGDGDPVKNRSFPGIRHMLTTASGIGAYDSVMVNDPDGPPGNYDAIGLKFDLHRQFNKTNTTGLDDRTRGLQQRLEIALKAGASANYLNLPDADVDSLIDEYIAVIKDYSDTGNTPTLHNGSYGLERLPFLREVYVQALYEDVLGDIADLAPWEAGYNPATPGTNYVGWKYDDTTLGDTRAMVIELGNPFSHEIEETDLDGRIKIVVTHGGTVSDWEFNSALAWMSSSTIGPRIDTGSGNDEDILIVYSRPATTTNETGGTHDGSNLPADLGFDTSGAVLLELPAGRLEFNPGDSANTIEVELQVLASDGQWVPYDRMVTDTRLSLQDQVKHAVNPVANHQHDQASFARDSDKIKYVVDDGVGSGMAGERDMASVMTYDDTLDRLGLDNKGVPAILTHPDDINFFEYLQLPLADQAMRSIAEMAQMHMFGFTAGETFSERMAANRVPVFKIGEHFLLIDHMDPEFVVQLSPPNERGLSYAAILMNHFTTVSPQHDGRDNDDNDGDLTIDVESLPTATADDRSIDNTTEQFIPGTINVNTATLPVLTLGSPLAEDIDDIEDLMRTIIEYRDQPILALANYPDDPETPFPKMNDMANIRALLDGFLSGKPAINRRLKPGIGSVGELLFLNPVAPTASLANLKHNMQFYGQDGTAVPLPANPDALPPKMDLYPDPDEASASRIEQGDDNEQRLARFQMLSQALSVRSDTYVAYVVVRGYQRDRFNDTPVESAQFIAVFNRGSLETDADPVSVKFLRLQ
jgi:hypothetical protein